VPESIPAVRFQQLSEFVNARLGLHFPLERAADLRRGMAAAAREFGCKNAEACADWLLSTDLSQPQIEKLASHLTIGETYFFREPKTFGILERNVLPELLRARERTGKQLRIWSAGCSSGEEPYSLAILLHRILPDLRDWQITILGTDISERALHKAREGIFGEWSFRLAPDGMRARYFTKVEKNRWKIARHIRELVTFSYLNLAEDVYPALLNHTHAMDLIFCRNVLMYFSPERASSVLGKFYCALVEGGWFIGSVTEHFHESKFAPVSFAGVTLYRKGAPPEAADALEKMAAKKKTSRFSPPPRELAAAEKSVPQSRAQIVSPVARAPAEMARVCANEGRLDEALALCDEAIAKEKLNAAHHYLRATILQERTSLGEAETALKCALFLDPGFVLAHFALGNLAAQQGREREARKHFENAFGFLRGYARDDVLPESEGMTAGRLADILQSMIPARSR
jgi:chemotaxis protein methyltransferase CheR